MGKIRPGRALLTLFVMGFILFFGMDLVARSNAGQEAASAAPPAVPTLKPQSSSPQAKPAGTARETAGVPASAKSGSDGSAAGKGGATAAGAKSQGASAREQGQRQASTQAPAARVQVKESFMNHLSNRLGDALHQLAKGLMGIIVSIFNSLIS